MRLLKSALLYFLAVFGTGFVLGIARVRWLVPAVGARAAELIEMPIMFAVMLFAARFVARRMPHPSTGRLLGVGVLAALLVLVCEFLLVLPLRKLTASQYFATLDPLTASAYYALIGVFAVLPLLTSSAPARSRTWVALAWAPVVVAGVVYVNFRHDLEIARQAATAGSRIARTGCGEIEYAVAGQGPPLLVVHGAGGGFDQGMQFAGDLSGFQVIAVSRFGYLRTPLPKDGSFAAQADAHACLLDALGVARVGVIGASAGAPSAMQFCIRHASRCNALVLLVPLAYPRPSETSAPPAMAQFMFERALQSDLLFWLAVQATPSLVMRTILATPEGLLTQVSAQERDRAQRMMDHILPLAARQQGLLNDAAVAASLPRLEIESIRAPTLAISVADDGYGTLDGARYSAAHIPGARLIAYETGGHLWLGHHREMVEEIGRFLHAAVPAAGRS